MVGREVLLRVDKSPSNPTDVLLDVEDLHVFDDRGIEKVRGLSLEVRAGEIVGIAGIDGNGQTELIDAMTGLRKVGVGPGIGGRRGRHRRQRPRPLQLGPRPHSRGPAAARARARVLDRREHRAPRLSPRARLQGWAGCSRAASSSARARLIKEFDVRGGGAQTPRGRPLGRQPAEGRPRPRDRPRPEGPDRRPADARPRRRRDRVRPPAARRGARRGTRDPAGLARARGDPVAVRPDPRHVRGGDRR